MTGGPGHGIDAARFVQAAGVAGLALSLLLVSLPRLKAAAKEAELLTDLR